MLQALMAGWDRRPVVIRGLGALVPPTAVRQSFAALWRKGSASQLRLFTAAAPAALDGRPALRPSETLRAWTDRLTRARGRHTMLVASDLTRADPVLAAHADQVVQPLFKATGAPRHGWEVGLFLGDYPYTAFGLHRDPVAVVLQMLFGTKAIYLWPPSAIRPAALARRGGDFRAFLSTARPFVLKRGDVLYWPAGWWHVGESRGVSGSLNFGLRTQGGTFAHPR